MYHAAFGFKISFWYAVTIKINRSKKNLVLKVLKYAGGHLQLEEIFLSHYQIRNFLIAFFKGKINLLSFFCLKSLN